MSSLQSPEHSLESAVYVHHSPLSSSAPAAVPASTLPMLAFVRHGATEPNLAGLRCGGDLNVPLTDIGREQALASAQRVLAQGQHIGLIVSSGLLRTDETARIIARRLGGVPVIAEPGFNERLLGEWNLCPLAETEPWLTMGMKPPGGEAADVFSARVEAALERLLPRLGEQVLLVSSRGVGRVLGELTGRPGRMVLGNGEVARFDITSFARYRANVSDMCEGQA